MKKIIILIVLCLTVFTLIADEFTDSLTTEINSLPFSYLKGDKIWDLALYYDNVLEQPQETIDNFVKATNIFIKLDSLSSAIRTNGSIILVAFNHPEFYEFSKEAFQRHISFLENKKLQGHKKEILTDVQRHLNNAYFIKEMEYLREGLGLMEQYFVDNKYDDIKIYYDQLQIMTTNYFSGEEKALEQSMQIYQDIENDHYRLNFGLKHSMRVKILSMMQNFYYYRGDIEQSNQLLDKAMTIALDVYTNQTDSLSSIEKVNFRTDIAQIMILKIDNIKITLENLPVIEKGFLDVNEFIKSFDKDREINNFVKIAHAYDVIYSGKHPKIKHYLSKAEQEIGLVNNALYLTNFHLTKARFLLNKKDYESANLAFLEVEKFIDKANQSWIKFNYIMERSRYYFEIGEIKTAYDLITEFYTNIDKDFSSNIASKTAELNNLIETKELKNEKIKLEKELEIKSLKGNRDTLITTLVGIVLGFTTLLLINNVKLNKKLKYSLSSQSEKLKHEIYINKKSAEELIVSEKLSTTGQIASSIAHEIKNPLTNIITASKLLRKSGNPEEIEKYFQICERNSWLAIDKVNSLLEYAKQKKLNFQECSLKTILRDAHSLSKGSLEKSNINLNLIYNTQNDIAKVDKKEMTGVIVNLILNSIQAMNEAQKDKLIELSLSNEANDFIIEVSDNGSGIPPEILSHVFNPFFTTKETGSGLGLNYAQKVLLEHFATIEVKSELDKGTKVIIKMPGLAS